MRLGPAFLFMYNSENPGPPASPPWRRDLLLLIVAFGLLAGFRLGSYPLANPDEGRNAEVPREMAASGDWVTPHLDGVNYFEKPPLVYWAVAGSIGIFGGNEWAVRAVPALFGLGGVLLTYVAGRRLYSRNAGMAAAVVLGTSLLYYGLSRFLVLDMAVSVLMSATLFCFILGVREPPGLRRLWLFYGLYAAAALATLTKGLIGVLVPGAVMFLWLLVFNQWKRLRPLHLFTGGLLFLGIAAPWHMLAAARNGTWVHRYFVFEHWERYTSDVASRPGPWWYFIPVVGLGLFPWIGFLWPALKGALRGGWASARKERADAWFLATWAGFIFLFFSASHSKLAPYVLPVFPPLAVLIGSSLARGLESVWPDRSAPARLKGGLRVFSFLCGLLAVTVLLAVMKVGVIIRDPVQALALQPPAFALAGVLLLGGIFAPWLARIRGAGAALGCVIVTTVLFYGVLTYAAKEIQKPGTKELALLVRTRAKPGDRVMHYHEFFHDFTFYAGRAVDVVAFKGELELEEDPAAQRSGRFLGEPEFRGLWAKPGRIFAVARKQDVGKLFADATFHYHLLAESRDHYLFSNQP